MQRNYYFFFRSSLHHHHWKKIQIDFVKYLSWDLLKEYFYHRFFTGSWVRLYYGCFWSILVVISDFIITFLLDRSLPFVSNYLFDTTILWKPLLIKNVVTRNSIHLKDQKYTIISDRAYAINLSKRVSKIEYVLVTLENITKFLFDAEIFDAIECAKAQMKFWSPMVLVKNKKKTLYLPYKNEPLVYSEPCQTSDKLCLWK